MCYLGGLGNCLVDRLLSICGATFEGSARVERAGDGGNAACKKGNSDETIEEAHFVMLRMQEGLRKLGSLKCILEHILKIN